MLNELRETDWVYNLKWSIYGLSKSPKSLFGFLRGVLQCLVSLQVVNLKPCLFISYKMIFSVYIDDCFFNHDEADILEVILKIKD